eukprot:Colp12_sorted_trinity150504_noHs@11123
MAGAQKPAPAKGPPLNTPLNDSNPNPLNFLPPIPPGGMQRKMSNTLPPKPTRRASAVLDATTVIVHPPRSAPPVRSHSRTARARKDSDPMALSDDEYGHPRPLLKRRGTASSDDEWSGDEGHYTSPRRRPSLGISQPIPVPRPQSKGPTSSTPNSSFEPSTLSSSPAKQLFEPHHLTSVDENSIAVTIEDIQNFKRKKAVSFFETVLVIQTFTAEEYDRRAHPQRWTSEDLQAAYMSLNTFKLHEMDVHPLSRHNIQLWHGFGSHHVNKPPPAKEKSVANTQSVVSSTTPPKRSMFEVMSPRNETFDIPITKPQPPSLLEAKSEVDDQTWYGVMSTFGVVSPAVHG